MIGGVEAPAARPPPRGGPAFFPREALKGPQPRRVLPRWLRKGTAKRRRAERSARREGLSGLEMAVKRGRGPLPSSFTTAGLPDAFGALGPPAEKVGVGTRAGPDPRGPACVRPNDRWTA